MKTFIGMFALLAVLALAGLMHPAPAFTSGGISGTILDASGHPVQGAPVSIFRRTKTASSPNFRSTPDATW